MYFSCHKYNYVGMSNHYVFVENERKEEEKYMNYKYITIYILKISPNIFTNETNKNVM